MRSLAILGAAGVLLLLPACRGGEEAQGEAVLATIDGKPVTLADVDARIAGVPRLARPEFSGPIGRRRMLDRIIEEEILYRAARDAGVDRDEEVRRAVEDATRQTVVQAYLDRVQADASNVGDEEARAFYDEHQEEYRTEKMVRVRVLVTPEEKIARRAWEMVTRDGMKFEDACTRFSENTYVVAARGLIPTWIRRDRAVPWIGNDAAFHEAVFSLEPDAVSEPFRTPLGWTLARVEEVRDSRQRPFDEVRDDVVGRMVRARTTDGLPQLIAELKEKYAVEILQEPGAKSADELFAEAQAVPQPQRRIDLYEELVERFPEHEHAVDSQFMIGFLLSEEIGDAERARAAFERVIEMAPDSDLAQSARWMLTSGEEDPEFEDDGWTAGQDGDQP
jgi:peptidyl-prolyl cis-trans isomerase C